MERFQTINLSINRSVSTIWLNRPEVRNAFNAEMINELLSALSKVEKDSQVRVIVIRGKGKVFCSGADLNWMRDAVNYSREENFREATLLSKLFGRIYACSKPVITVVHGASTGGANGLVAASDVALSADDAVFSLSEVKSGLVPAVISPYIIKRTGEFSARELMLTARRIYGKEAAERRLVNHSFPAEELDRELGETIDHLLEGGPEALKITKSMIRDVCNNWNFETAVEETAVIIADMRTSEEGQEGMTAFLEKRKPGWVEKYNMNT